MEVFSADPKKAVTTMLKKCDRMHGPLYHFQTVQEILQRAGWCSLYSAHIQIPIGALFILPIQIPIGRPHLFVAGFPCAPFCTQRASRWSEGGWQSHKESQVMKDVEDSARRRTDAGCSGKCARLCAQVKTRLWVPYNSVESGILNPVTQFFSFVDS